MNTRDASATAADGKTLFLCVMCGECCRGVGGIILQAHDSVRLALEIGCSQQEFSERYTTLRNGKQNLRTNDNGLCMFALGDGRCGVHMARPDICRAWPFFRGNLVDAVSFAMAREACPGIGAHVSFEDFCTAGREYLREHGLACQKRAMDSPVALCIPLPEEGL